jgi:hypothetical protein
MIKSKWLNTNGMVAYTNHQAAETILMSIQEGYAEPLYSMLTYARLSGWTVTIEPTDFAGERGVKVGVVDATRPETLVEVTSYAEPEE